MSTAESNANLDSSLRENRLFPPPAEFAAKAHIKSLAQYEAMYRRSVEQPEEFWAEAALPHPSRRNRGPQRWAGLIGLVLGSALGIVACYALATLL